MAGIGSYIEHRPGRLFYTISSDVLHLVAGDEIAAAFIDVLDFRSRDELSRSIGKQEPPDVWPEDIWVQQEMGAFACQWMLGATSEKSIRQRIDWLEHWGVISTRQEFYGATRQYRLNVKTLNKLLKDRYQIDSLRLFLKDQDSPGEFGRSLDTSGKTTEGTSGNFTGAKAPYKILGTNEVKQENKKTLPTLSEKPSEEKPQDPEPEQPTCPTLDNLDLEMPVKKFVQNQLRNEAHVKKVPKFSNAAERWTLDKLQKADEDWTPTLFRSAFVGWCRDDNPYLREEDYPVNHFLKHIEEYIPDMKSVGIPLPPAALSAREVVEAVRQGAAPVPIVPAVPSGRPVPADIVATWNRIVTLKPFSGANPDGVFDPDFTYANWEKACDSAQAIIQAKGKEVSWLTMRWAFRKPKQGDIEGWRKLAEGELDCMAFTEKSSYKTKGQEQTEMVDRVIDKYRRRAEEAAKKEQEKTDGLG